MVYFVFSDVHGDYNALILELDKKGFEKHDPNHTLISLGDNFDRGLKSREVFEFLDSLKRKILIKGNHELMLKKVLEKEGCLEYIDYCNGLGETFSSFNYFNYSKPYYLINWINNMKWYYETKNYIFTHSWLPYDFRKEKDEYFWESAVWAIIPEEIEDYGKSCPLYEKTLVFGHWGTHLLHNDKNNHGIWEDKKKKLIGLDATSVISNKVNVLVIEEEPIE